MKTWLLAAERDDDLAHKVGIEDPEVERAEMLDADTTDVEKNYKIALRSLTLITIYLFAQGIFPLLPSSLPDQFRFLFAILGWIVLGILIIWLSGCIFLYALRDKSLPMRALNLSLSLPALGVLIFIHLLPYIYMIGWGICYYMIMWLTGISFLIFATLTYTNIKQFLYLKISVSMLPIILLSICVLYYSPGFYSVGFVGILSKILLISALSLALFEIVFYKKEYLNYKTEQQKNSVWGEGSNLLQLETMSNKRLYTIHLLAATSLLLYLICMWAWAYNHARISFSIYLLSSPFTFFLLILLIEHILMYKTRFSKKQLALLSILYILSIVLVYIPLFSLIILIIFNL